MSGGIERTDFNGGGINNTLSLEATGFVRNYGPEFRLPPQKCGR
jgi:hypothetical protein